MTEKEELENALGFVFEIGFNMGIASCLEEKFKEEIKRTLKHSSYMRHKVYSSLTRTMSDEVEKAIICKNIDYLLFKGLLSGKSFFREFIKNKGEGKPYETVYFQADFYRVFDKQKEQKEVGEYYRTMVRQQLGISLEQGETDILFHKGEAFKADMILMIKVGRKYHLCVVDNSISTANIRDIGNINVLKEIYKGRIFRKRSKSSFSYLAMEDGSEQFPLNMLLEKYILGMGHQDKPLLKMVQAGSYAYSFLRFLKRHKWMREEDIGSICIAGYTDEEMCSMNVTLKNKLLLETCYKAYHMLGKQKGMEQVENALVMAKMIENFKQIFKVNESFFRKLMYPRMSQQEIVIKEVLQHFQETAGSCLGDGKIATFRDIHAEAVRHFISDPSKKILFLTGNPGIGKTTAIVEYLKQQEGYIFIYLSPRTQVNQDIGQKFSVGDRLYDDDVVYLTSTGHDEVSSHEENVNIVNFWANHAAPYEQIKEPVRFMNDKRMKQFEGSDLKLKILNSTTYGQEKSRTLGVLNRLSQGINQVIRRKLSHKIIAAAAIQALKTTADGKSTARHLLRIFSTVYSEKVRGIDEEAFSCFAKAYPNVIFMVDEITGDEGGVALLHEMLHMVFDVIESRLPLTLRQNINLKVVVADASITDVEVVKRHLGSMQADHDKIYFKVEPKMAWENPNIAAFNFMGSYESIWINTNAYPAQKLYIDYRILRQIKVVHELKEMGSLVQKSRIDMQLAQEAARIIAKHQSEQVLIYVQDIRRLEDICHKLKSYYQGYTGGILKEEEYLMIHSCIGEGERKKILRCKETAKFICMTSSASRGLSFPKAAAILVDVPKFEIEKNIMEILQVIYRGRGKTKDGIEIGGDKFIVFYISNTVYDDEVNSQLAIQGHTINLLTVLILIKACLVTRIQGGLLIGHQRMSLIPLGGKGLNKAADMLIETFEHLMRHLKKEHLKDRNNKQLKKMISQLMALFGTSTIVTEGEICRDCRMEEIGDAFYRKWDEGFEQLLDFMPFNNPYVLGDMVIFKLNKKMQSTMHFRRDLIWQLLGQSNSLRQVADEMLNDGTQPGSLKIELKKAMDLLEYFKSHQVNYSMNFIDVTDSNDHFITFPICVPLEMESFKNYVEIGEENSFRGILEAYVRTDYSINGVLPITGEYDKFPFIEYKSNTLISRRDWAFKTQYIFCSSEINLLKLMMLIN